MKPHPSRRLPWLNLLGGPGTRRPGGFATTVASTIVSVSEGVRSTTSLSGGLLGVLVTVLITVPTPALAGTGDRYAPEPAAHVPELADYVPAAIRPGSSGTWVLRLQDRLATAGFRPGPADGVFGGATLGAVYAFQKVHDLERDGVFRREYWPLLEMAVSVPEAEEPDRVEVDLDRQVLYLVERQRVAAILPISSGNGETYRNATGALVRARTPEGGFRFYSHVDGWRISYLGALYRPFYFRGGYAIHGSGSVPPYPASHGCVRVELEDMDFLTTRLSIGMPIYVYGRTTDRAAILPTPINGVAESSTIGWPFALT